MSFHKTLYVIVRDFSRIFSATQPPKLQRICVKCGILLSSIWCQPFVSSLFPSDLKANIFSALHISLMLDGYPAHLILFDLITSIIRSEYQ